MTIQNQAPKYKKKSDVLPKKPQGIIGTHLLDDVIIVGKKGEILPKKNLREIAGISPGDRVVIKASPGTLIIDKIYSAKELLAMPIIASGTAEELENEINEEAKKQFDMMDA